MKFRKGQKVERQIGDRWVASTISFVWRGVDLETGKRIFHYDVTDEVAGPVGYKALKVPESELRRPNAARGRKKVLRSHSARLESFT